MPKRLASRQSNALARELDDEVVGPRPRPAVLEPVTATDDEVRTAAYHRWEAAGRPSGDGVEFWLAAERELRE